MPGSSLVLPNEYRRIDMIDEMNRTIEVLKIAISREYAKDPVNVERIEELEAGQFWLEKSAMFMAEWQIEQQAIEAERLCNKSEGLIETMLSPLLFIPNDENDPQKMGHS